MIPLLRGLHRLLCTAEVELLDFLERRTGEPRPDIRRALADFQEATETALDKLEILGRLA